MASLFNTRISDTYSGLIKTIDNAALTSSLKELTDGSGLASGVFMNTAGDFKVTAILEFGSLKDTGENITISKFVDAADGVLNNDNDTSIPTTAAIIDYVQGHVTLQDLDFEGDSGNGSVDLDSQLLDIAGTANQITTLASNQTLTISFDSSGVVLPDGSTATTQSQGDNSTKVATTAYVDILDAASDLDFSGDSGTGDVNLNTQTFAVTGTTNQIVTAASGQGLSLSLPATVHRNLQGDVTGDVTGDLTGNVTATSVLADGVTATTQASSDDSTKVATTAYVKSLNNASDLDFTTDSGSGAVILNSQTFSVVGTTNEIETSGSGQQIQIGLPSSINVNVTGNTTGTHTGAVVGNVTGDVVGDLTGNADTATAWETARDLSITGQATGTISSVDGTGNVSGAVTLDNNSVTSKVLTGLTSPSASSVLATDTIVEGFGKLQSQVNGLAGGLRFIGSWDADTNSPVLSSGGGEAANGTTTGVQANKLIDSSASFTSTVTVGDKVVNQVDGQTALVSNVDSDTTLSLDADIMLSGEAYTIDNSPFITQGHYYVVSVGGTTTLNGVSNWTVGDWVIAGANNQWTKLDHSQIDGTGTTGNLTKWSATQVIADSIVSESGSAITVDGSLSTNTNLSSTGDFAVNTNKFTVAAASGNTAFAGDLAINTDKFTVNATTGNTLVAGTLDVTGKTTFGDDITISDGTPILDFEDTNNTDSNWRMEARGSFGGFFFQSFDNNFQTGSTVLFAKSSNGYIGLGGNTNPQAELDITGGLIAEDVFTTDSTGSTITVSRDAVPTSGNSLGKFEFSGEDIDTGNQYVTAQISASAEANWATSSRTTQLNFNTTTGGVLSRALTLKGNNDAEFEGNVTFAENVGIGTGSDTLTRNLTVKGTTTSNINIKSNASNGTSILSLGDSDDDNYAQIILENSSNKLQIQNGGGGALGNRGITLDSSQNVGIGTADPAAKFSVLESTANTEYASMGSGSTIARHLKFSGFVANGTNNVGHRLSALNAIALNVAGDDALYINNSGNVGISTDSPQTNLHINKDDASPVLLVKASGQTSSTTPFAKLVLAAGSASGADVGSNIMGYRTADFSSAAARSTGLKFGVLQNNVAKDAMWITEAQNVGIGTDSPSEKLEISENQNPTLRFNNEDDGVVTGDTFGTIEWYTNDPSTSGTGIAATIKARAASSFTGSNRSTNITFSTASGTTAPTERMRIDSNGYVTIKNNAGVDSASLTFSNSDIGIGINQSIGYLNFYSNDSSTSSLGGVGGIAVKAEEAFNTSFTPTYMSFYTHERTNNNGTSLGNVTERMRITSGGDVLVAKQAKSTTVNGIQLQSDNIISVVSSGLGYFYNKSDGGSAIAFQFRSGNVDVGSISVTSSATAYNTSSDYRLKEDLQDFNGLDKVSKIPVYDFKWTTDESRSYGVMAHELQEVLPQAVNGKKDAEEMQSVDYSKIVPLLVKSIQELKAEVDKLKQECKCKN